MKAAIPSRQQVAGHEGSHFRQGAMRWVRDRNLLGTPCRMKLDIDLVGYRGKKKRGKVGKGEEQRGRERKRKRKREW